MENIKKIIVVGGGFGGVQCTLSLAKKRIPNAKIILISNKNYFEYTASLYRVVTGRSPMGAGIPLRDIFQSKDVEVLEDTIIKADLKEKKLKGESGSDYSFDFLVLALGSETVYFNIPGLKELSIGFKTINESLRLKKHLHGLFAESSLIHIVVVGGGASGTEIAGELAAYTKELAKKHKISPSFITIDLIEASSRLLPSFPEDFSERVKKRLYNLGVNIFLNRALLKEEIGQVYLKDMELKTKTLIWTAGVAANSFCSEIGGFIPDNKGRIAVDDFLQAKGWLDIFVIGDAAATPYSGMAQTAIFDGNYVSQVIAFKIAGKEALIYKYKPNKPSYAVPVGPGWAAVLINNFKIYGRMGWLLRRLADFHYFISILSFKKAISVFLSGRTLFESCLICETEEKYGKQ